MRTFLHTRLVLADGDKNLTDPVENQARHPARHPSRDLARHPGRDPERDRDPTHNPARDPDRDPARDGEKGARDASSAWADSGSSPGRAGYPA